MVFLTLVEAIFQIAPHQEILIIGDSQACVMKFGAIAAVKQANETVDVVCKVSTRTAYWEGSRMKDALSAKRYDVTIIFLGSNDYGSKPDPTKIVQQVLASGAKCIWVGPPLIRGQKTATNSHLAATVPPCSYLDSQALGVPLADGIHPTGAGAILWLNKAWEIKNSLLYLSQP